MILNDGFSEVQTIGCSNGCRQQLNLAQKARWDEKPVYSRVFVYEVLGRRLRFLEGVDYLSQSTMFVYLAVGVVEVVKKVDLLEI